MELPCFFLFQEIQGEALECFSLGLSSGSVRGVLSLKRNLSPEIMKICIVHYSEKHR